MTSFTKDDVEVIKKESLHDGYFNTNKYYIKHRKYDGGWTEVFTREVFERGHAVAVLLYDPTTEEFVLIEQFRFPAMETAKTPWLIEVVAGIIDEGETHENVCHREAQEEAGVVIEKLTKACEFLMSPGGSTERLYAYVGKVDSTKADGIHGLDEETEDIKVLRVPELHARDWLDSGKIDNSTAIILLQWFFLNKAKLLNEWQHY
ncbi:ADP-ribose diphosphatase [Agaribacter marinus]|uniref:ADP-ribose pyrophosphatase n=1 Tax=Agaribacter marinus TaxID=1431249 RepID=A0AA37T294_9ALTE|nr:ADP-ribose diphosphatase [Agaribacter marinus]GLR72615.1 ADP-ribose pyrophosphatase [Agaribacter marinus]